VLKEVLWRIASLPWVYDQIQFMAGTRSVYRRIAYQAATLAPDSLVLDLGGGTGLYREAWAAARIYMNLDLDMLKLQRCVRKTRDSNPILADGTCIPFRDNSIDVVICVGVSHHLSDRALEEMIHESCRVLRIGGTLLLLDAVWAPERYLGKLIWKYDRGSYPRTAEYLHSVISQQFRIIYSERYAVYHEYVLYRGIRQVEGNEC
jgi:ubiquinone/menaquinone biosynthesis C-methylase UbiE